jgi:hypothetical protein
MNAAPASVAITPVKPQMMAQNQTCSSTDKSHTTARNGNAAVFHPLAAAPEMTRTKVASIVKALPQSKTTTGQLPAKPLSTVRAEASFGGRKQYVDAASQTNPSRQDIKVAREIAVATRGLVDSLQPLLEAS